LGGGYKAEKGEGGGSQKTCMRLPEGKEGGEKGKLFGRENTRITKRKTFLEMRPPESGEPLGS